MTPAKEPETAVAAFAVAVTGAEVDDPDELTVAVPVLKVLLGLPVGTGPDPMVEEPPFPPGAPP